MITLLGNAPQGEKPMHTQYNISSNFNHLTIAFLTFFCVESRSILCFGLWIISMYFYFNENESDSKAKRCSIHILMVARPHSSIG